jgi:hypothetical protein
MVRTLVIGAVVGLGFGAVLSDPPRIEGWHLIGNVGLGYSKARVEYAYGAASANWPSSAVTYRVHGGRLEVGYDTRGVAYIATTSAYYRTAAGLGVGSAIPLGPCIHTRSGCTYRWGQFRYDALNQWWSKYVPYGKRTIEVRLKMNKGTVARVEVTFNDCYSPGACVP